MKDSERFAPGGLLGGRYRLEKVIGAGGMASVWLATDENLSRPVAVKALSDALAADPAYVARFEREARIAAGLSHPNLVEVLDSGLAGERPFLVMEHVQGPTLAEAMERDLAGPDPEQLARQLLGALEHIHAAGVIHRDVKPANVLIGDDGRARLTDFGIARPEDATDLTKTGQVIGTLRYMAPEVLEGKPADERSDLYSCGVLLREWAGDRPGRGMGRLLRRLTAKRPGRRPRSAQAALAALGEGGAPPTAPAAEAKTEPLPGGPTASTRRLPASQPAAISRGSRGKWLLAAAAAVALAVGLLVAGTIGDESSEQAGNGEPARKPAADAAPAAPAAPPPAAPAGGASAPAGEQEVASEEGGEAGESGKGPKPGKGPKQEKGGKGKGKGK